MSSLGASRGRSETRHRRRRYLASLALRSFLALARLAGPRVSALSPSSSLPSSPYSNNWASYSATQVKLARSHHHSISNLHIYQSSHQVLSLPPWARLYYNQSSQSATLSATKCWNVAVACTRIYHCRSRRSDVASSSGMPTLEANHFVLLCDYARSSLEKDEAFRPLVASEVSLPPRDHTPRPMEEMLPPVWQQIFSRDGYHRLLDPISALFAPTLKAANVYESPAQEFALLKALQQRKMCEFMPAKLYKPKAVCGLFGLAKPPPPSDPGKRSTRMLCDERPGNAHHIRMPALQRLYESKLSTMSSDERHLLRPLALDLPHTSTLSALPPGGLTKTRTDLSDFFHFILVPDWIRDYQCLPRVRAIDVGLDPVRVGTWVWPRLCTLAMGYCFAPLIAQLVHEFLLLPVLSRPLLFEMCTPTNLPVPVQLLAHGQGDDGLVELSRVPPLLLTSLLKIAGLSALPDFARGLRVPPSVFGVVLAGVESGKELVQCNGWDCRDGDLELAISAHKNTSAHSLHFTFMLYIDDHHDVWFRDSKLGLGTINLFANFWMLLSLLICTNAGLRASQSKLHWASHVPSKTLGIYIDFSSFHTYFYADPLSLNKVCSSALELIHVAREARSSGRSHVVSIAYLHHLLGKFVWAFCLRRPLLSIFWSVYRLLRGRENEDMVVLRESVCVEF
jgi:hypothetical protein